MAMKINRGAEKAKETAERKVATMFKFMNQLAEKDRLNGGKPLRKLQEDVLKKIQSYIESNYKG